MTDKKLPSFKELYPELRGNLPSANHMITLLGKPLADYEGLREIWRRHSLALAKIVEQNEMILIELQRNRC